MNVDTKVKLAGAVSVKTKAMLAVGMLAAFLVGTAFAALALNTFDDPGNMEVKPPRNVIVKKDLNAVINTVNPAPSLVQSPAGVEYSVVGRFDLRASDVPLSIRSMTFQVVDPDGGIMGGWINLTDLQLFENGVSISNVNVSSSAPTFILNTAIPAKTTKNYVLKGILISNLGTESGHGLRLKLIDVVAMYNNERVPVLGLGNPFNTFSVVKSIPQIGLVPYDGRGRILHNSPSDLMKFRLTATSTPFAFYKLSFDIYATNVLFYDSAFYLYESNSPDIQGDVIAKGRDFVNLLASSTPGAITTGFAQAYLDVNDDTVAAPANEHRIISPYQTKYYTLKALVSPSLNASSTINTTLLGDEWFANTQPENAGQIDLDLHNDFIWSDLNFDLYSTSTATHTLGWFNGFRIPGWQQFSQFITN